MNLSPKRLIKILEENFRIMEHTKIQGHQYTPDSVPTVSQIKVYYADEIRTLGGIEAWLKLIGSDKPKKLPEIDFSEEEWTQMLNEGL